MRLDGRIAIVTGGGSGIGAATCVALAAEGAKVFVFDIDEKAASDVANRIRDGIAVHCDVSDSGQVDDAVNLAANRFGRIDILVNNAGILGGDEYRAAGERMRMQFAEVGAGGPVRTPLDAILNLTDAQWTRMLATHLNGVFFCTRAAIRPMAATGGGAIVNMASMAGLIGVPGNPHYSAAKAGILGFTRSAAKELIVQGIRVNAIAPGVIDTPLRSLVPDVVSAAQLRGVPMGRFGTAEEVADTVLFLVSDASKYIVGETITIAGGLVTI